MSELAALRVERLEKSYKSFTLKMNFQLARGQVLGLVGPNGAGKTTLIHCLLRLIRWERGRIFFFGLDLEREEVTIKRRIGFFLESAPLFAEHRVSDLLAFFASFYPTWDWRLAQESIERFELTLSQNKKVKELSKGMKAKLGLVTAFTHRPEVLILDEPTAGLDPGMRREFIEFVRAAQNDFHPAILLTSHIMADIEDLADRIAFLSNGALTLIDEKRRLLQNWHRVSGRCVGELNLGLDEFVLTHYNQVTGDLQLVTNRWDSKLDHQLKTAGLQDIQVHPMTLEEIYSFVIPTRRKDRTDAGI